MSKYEFDTNGGWTKVKVQDSGEQVNIYETVNGKTFEQFGYPVPLDDGRGGKEEPRPAHTHTAIGESYEVLHDRGWDDIKYSQVWGDESEE